MKIRLKLTLLFTLITATILLFFAGFIYYSAKKTRESEFYSILKKEAITKANLLFNAKVKPTTLQKIYLNNRQILSEVEVAIYDLKHQLLYHDAIEIDFVKETPAMLEEISRSNQLNFIQGRTQVTGITYDYDGQKYIVVASAYDQYGFNKLNILLINCIVLFVISVVIIYLSGRFFSKKAFEPVLQMTRSVAKITASNLDSRITNNNNNDELSELANTFNDLLSRMESSFNAQKQFVSNISHEIRTPLSAIITELELTAYKERSIEEYKLTIQNTLNDSKRLVRLSNSLLDFAKASYDPSEIAFKKIRIDEALIESKLQIQHLNQGYKIDIEFEKSIQEAESDNIISVEGNEYLLKVAFANLMENACKFSEDKKCLVYVKLWQNQIVISFKDHGIGIDAYDTLNIFHPFYRGNNKHYAEGNGIGLSLVQKITLLHQGFINVSSVKGEGSTFVMTLPYIR